MNHRKIFTLLAGAAVAMVASLSSALAEKIVISNWDGYMPKDMAEKFKAETGIDLEVAVHATNEEIMGKVTASGGAGFDVLFVSSPFAEALNKLGLLAAVDHGKIPNIAPEPVAPVSTMLSPAFTSRENGCSKRAPLTGSCRLMRAARRSGSALSAAL